jgi:MFS family permease
MNGYVTMDDMIARSILALLFIGTILTMYFAGRIAQRRGRSFKNWALIAGTLIGPLAFPLLLLLPNLQRKDPDGPEGEQRPLEAIGAAKPGIQGNPGPAHLHMSFSFR